MWVRIGPLGVVRSANSPSWMVIGTIVTRERVKRMLKQEVVPGARLCYGIDSLLAGKSGGEVRLEGAGCRWQESTGRCAC